ncbi:7 transmembrane receptor, partial [Salmonella sp. s51228]|uniref:7 transmembrane receptor n=1 Tax=Salmonella sp. s51228 TaxID=3159652 RepID=UPI00397F6DDF
ESLYKFNIPCTIVALLLQYFWTAVFSWALCNGIYIFYKLWIARLSERRIWIPLALFGWILPVIPVIVTISITQGNYIQSSEERSNCWLAESNIVRLSFLTPLLVILVLNFIILIISAIRIVVVRKEDSAFKKIKSFAYSCIILTPVLGLPWTIMFLRIATESINWGEGNHVV